MGAPAGRGVGRRAEPARGPERRECAVELRGLERAEWKSLGRSQGYGLVGPDGAPWLRAKVKSGTFRTTGQIEVAAGHEPALPALIAAYLLIRKADESAAAASATAGAT